MDSVTAVSIEEHLQVMQGIKERAEAIAEEDVLEPELPVMIFIKEVGIAASGAREHFLDLAKVGFKESMIQTLEADLAALSSAQALWNTERRGGRSEAAQQIVDECEECRLDLLSASDLALRKQAAGQRRISLIREGEGLADLIADLKDLALLITDFKALFLEINLDVDQAPKQAVQLAGDLQNVLSTEKVGKTLTGYKALRDRCYTLTKESLEEVRSFAARAFRKDKTDTRKNLFTSAYLRRQNRLARNRRNEAEKTQTTSNP
jgi:hypothetical protein